MKLLDRYILKKFLGTFVFTVFIIMAIVVVVHLSDNTERFIKAEVSNKKIIDYYLNFVPWMANSLTPLIVFIATVFVTAQLAVRTEIIAMLSNGVSFARLLLPYLIGAFAIASISFALTCWVIPNGNKSLAAFEVKYFKKKASHLETNIHLQLPNDIYLYIQSFDNENNVGYYFTQERIEGTELLEKLSADSVVWVPEQNKWTLYNWKVQIAQDLEEHMTSGLRLDSAISIHPRDFASPYKDEQGLTLNELDKEIDKLQLRGSMGVITYEVEKYIRYAAPFAILILTLMGVLVASKKSRGGTGFQIALGFLLCFVYIISFTFGKAIAETGGFNELIGPAFSIWIPNILFLLIALIIYRYVPK